MTDDLNKPGLRDSIVQPASCPLCDDYQSVDIPSVIEHAVSAHLGTTTEDLRPILATCQGGESIDDDGATSVITLTMLLAHPDGRPVDPDDSSSMLCLHALRLLFPLDNVPALIEMLAEMHALMKGHQAGDHTLCPPGMCTNPELN